MSKVWIVGKYEISEHKNLKVFKEKDDAVDYVNEVRIKNYNVAWVEAELVWVVPPPFPLPPSKYKCSKCNNQRPPYFDFTYQDNMFNVDKGWCDICGEDTLFEKIKK